MKGKKFEVKAHYDVVILGSGISGLICALELSKRNKKVCVLSKEAVTEGSSIYAQGGIAVPINKSDSIESHIKDTLIAGAGLSDESVARKIIGYSKEALEKLISYGVKFDLNQMGEIEQTKEAAHTFPRICHVGGDASGRHIVKTLIDKACRDSNISISQGTIGISIIKNKKSAINGLLVQDITKEKYILGFDDLIIASGGVGQLFENTTNPRVSTGDGIAMAFLAGAELQDVEMIQFHPTVLRIGKLEPMLITEAIRGEGAKLKNINGEYFASKYHPSAELAPRDILSRAIDTEIRKTNSNHVLLDLSEFTETYFKSRFPTIYNYCHDNELEIFKDGIPVFPAVHYFIGGIKCDSSGKTNIPNLWVVGESASSGFHGANRLASNSLLECIVTPHFMIEKLVSREKTSQEKVSSADAEFDDSEYKEEKIISDYQLIQKRNSLNLGLRRNEKDMDSHLAWLESMANQYNICTPSSNYHVQEIKNMILLSKFICNAALNRKESLGAHFREDFSEPAKELRHSVVSVKNGFSWKPVSKEIECKV